jgi:hypothetical protein
VSATLVTAWEATAAAGLVEAIDGTTVDIAGQSWDADHRDDDGDPAEPGVVWLTCHDDGRTVLARVTVEVIEGCLT